MIINTVGGETSLLGRTRQFMYVGEEARLSITGLSLEEATAILRALEELSGGVAPVEDPPPAAVAPPAESKGSPAPHANGDVNKERIKLIAEAHPAKPPAAPKAPKKDKAKDPPAPATEKQQELPGVAKAAPEEEEMVPNAAGVLEPKGLRTRVEAAHGPVAGQPEPEEASTAPAADLPEELASARTLRDILTYLIEKEELTDEAAIQARCDTLKESVPVLKRIQDLDARVKRTLEVMDMSGDAT